MEISLFDIIKKSRKYRQTFNSSIDNVTDNIPMHFAKIYENLYNSVEDKDDLRIVEENINSHINTVSIRYIDYITKEVLTTTLKKVKP